MVTRLFIMSAGLHPGSESSLRIGCLACSTGARKSIILCLCQSHNDFPVAGKRRKYFLHQSPRLQGLSFDFLDLSFDFLANFSSFFCHQSPTFMNRTSRPFFSRSGRARSQPPSSTRQ
jgi:hypothetical protein